MISVLPVYSIAPVCAIASVSGGDGGGGFILQTGGKPSETEGTLVVRIVVRITRSAPLDWAHSFCYTDCRVDPFDRSQSGWEQIDQV